MIRSITKVVVVPANSEVVVDFISGQPGKTLRVVSVHQEQTAAMTCRCYLDQDRIVDAAGEIDDIDFHGVPVDLPLKEGQTFKGGFENTTGGSLTKHLMVLVEEI